MRLSIKAVKDHFDYKVPTDLETFIKTTKFTNDHTELEFRRLVLSNTPYVNFTEWIEICERCGDFVDPFGACYHKLPQDNFKRYQHLYDKLFRKNP